MAPVTDAVRTYHLDEAAHGSFAHPILGEIVWGFPAGDVTPVSEEEELVLEAQLVPLELATVVDDAIEPWRVSARKAEEREAALQAVAAAGPEPFVAPTDGHVLTPDETAAAVAPKPGTREALQAEAAALGLSTDGTKAELRARIDDSAATNPEGDA
jgi:hypothetical protein